MTAKAITRQRRTINGISGYDRLLEAIPAAAIEDYKLLAQEGVVSHGDISPDWTPWPKEVSPCSRRCAWRRPIRVMGYSDVDAVRELCQFLFGSILDPKTHELYSGLGRFLALCDCRIPVDTIRKEMLKHDRPFNEAERLHPIPVRQEMEEDRGFRCDDEEGCEEGYPGPESGGPITGRTYEATT